MRAVPKANRNGWRPAGLKMLPFGDAGRVYPFPPWSDINDDTIDDMVDLWTELRAYRAQAGVDGD